jgi:hypothetical protein
MQIKAHSDGKILSVNYRVTGSNVNALQVVFTTVYCLRPVTIFSFKYSAENKSDNDDDDDDDNNNNKAPVHLIAMTATILKYIRPEKNRFYAFFVKERGTRQNLEKLRRRLDLHCAARNLTPVIHLQKKALLGL